ncbi:MAG: iron-containing alcohol dehydrogenase, partial [Treponema sp.]|nr:iron-containing alcohol dehydrogenase [Treponema sp.]
MAFNFTMPARTIIGEGAFDTSLPFIKEMGVKALIVTGKIITKTGLTSVIQKKLSDTGIGSVVFNDLPGEPDDRMIMSAVDAYRNESCDFVIGLGGGTP